MYQKVNVGMFGLGTVGVGVINYLRQFYDSSKTGLEIHVSKICVRDPAKIRDVNVQRHLTKNPDDILEDPTINVVVEVMGGIEPAGPYIKRALSNGKHVVTANKSLLTHYDDSEMQQRAGELIRQGKWPKGYGGWHAFLAALSNKTNIAFEASVCGEIPVIEVVSAMPSRREIRALEGIINGTSNYLLTRMSQGIAYETALKEAQGKGFAESDPSLDVDGIDAAQKLAILSTLIFGNRIELPQIMCDSMKGITTQDVRYAQEFGYVIKPIAKAVRHEGNLLELRVAPTLLPKSDNLSFVNSERNAVSLYFKGRDEPLTLEGLGAGRMPTARSVVADIVRVVTSPHESRYWIYNLFTCSPQDYSGLMQMLVSPYYLRLDVDDKPGVLGNVGTIIGANGVNIEEVRQMQNEKKDGSIPMVLLVGPANELTIIKMIDELQNQSYVKEILKIRRKPK